MRILGLELGSYSVKAVELESRFRRIDLLDLHEIKLPLEITDPTAVYKSAIAKLMARLPTHPEKIVCSLPPAQVALRFLQLPIKQRKKVEQTYRFELEDNIPLKFEECLVEHYVSRKGEGSLVFAALAPKKLITAHIQWLKDIGLDPDWFTFDGMGLINLYLSAQLTKDEEQTSMEPVLLLDIGHTKTNAAVIQQGSLFFFRSLKWGGLNLTQAIAHSLNIPIEEAERVKIQELNLNKAINEISGQAKSIISGATQAFIPFLAELQHCMVAYRSSYNQDIGAIRITGGTSLLNGIDTFLSSSLTRPVGNFYPIREAEMGKEVPESEESRFGEALGRGLVFARKALLLFNFRKQEMAKDTTINEISGLLKNPIVVKVGQFAVGLLGILFLYTFAAAPFSKKESRATTETLNKVFQDTFRTVSPKTRTALIGDTKQLAKFIDQKSKELDQKLNLLSRKQLSMLTITQTLSDSFPSSTRVDVNSMFIDDRTFSMEGVLYEGNLDIVAESLNRNPTFSNVTIAKDGQRFSFRGEIKGR